MEWLNGLVLACIGEARRHGHTCRTSSSHFYKDDHERQNIPMWYFRSLVELRITRCIVSTSLFGTKLDNHYLSKYHESFSKCMTSSFSCFQCAKTTVKCSRACRCSRRRWLALIQHLQHLRCRHEMRGRRSRKKVARTDPVPRSWMNHEEAQKFSLVIQP